MTLGFESQQLKSQLSQFVHLGFREILTLIGTTPVIEVIQHFCIEEVDTYEHQ
jgi:hypothetical protein